MGGLGNETHKIHEEFQFYSLREAYVTLRRKDYGREKAIMNVKVKQRGNDLLRGSANHIAELQTAKKYEKCRCSRATVVSVFHSTLKGKRGL